METPWKPLNNILGDHIKDRKVPMGPAACFKSIWEGIFKL